MRLVSAIAGTALGGWIWRGLDSAMRQGEILVLSRRRIVETVQLAEEPSRFWLSVTAHTTIFALAVAVVVLALIERPSNRIGRRRR